MKKILAVVMAIVMSFSLALVPVSAAQEDVQDGISETVVTAFDAIEKTVDLIMDTIVQVHNIVGQIMAVVGKECVLCGAMHEILPEAGADDEVAEDEVVEEEVTETTEALAA